jgi:hypothetical protein
MAANLKISSQKGIETAIMAMVSIVITEGVVIGLGKLGIHVDSVEIKVAVISLLTGALQLAHNWWDHHKTSVAK